MLLVRIGFKSGSKVCLVSIMLLYAMFNGDEA